MTVKTLREMDARLASILPETFREGIHLAMLYATTHRNTQWHEMRAFRLIRDETDLPLDTETVLKVYRAMTEDTDAECRGWKCRNCRVEGEGTFYIPATWEETPALMNALCERYRHLGENPEETLSNAELEARLDDICRFLLEFSCIHPVLDGNGRLRNLLGQMLLQRAGLSCAIYTPWDAVLKIDHGRDYFVHVILASGICYGMKPLEDGRFLPFLKGTLAEAYQSLDAAIRCCVR